MAHLVGEDMKFELGWNSPSHVLAAKHYFYFSVVQFFELTSSFHWWFFSHFFIFHTHENTPPMFNWFKRDKMYIFINKHKVYIYRQSSLYKSVM